MRTSCWLQWLDQNEIAYVLRIKSNTVVGKHLAREHAASSRRNLKSKRKVFGFGLELFFACKSIRQGARSSHLMVVSNRFRDKEALALYRKRWGVERLFGHLKRKGFDLESTHLTDPAKLEKLFAVVVIAFLFSYLRPARKSANCCNNCAAIHFLAINSKPLPTASRRKSPMAWTHIKPKKP